ncbi:MAG: TPM domain-containing protein [Bacteroidales bacterium]|nr:TPM domain-containing protein [Bacteroidales bacterium]
MKKAFFVIFAFIGLIANAQSIYEETGWLPEKGNHLVYDYCGILTESQNDSLEFALHQFNDSTSNQIVVIIAPALGGRDAASFAIEVGNKWGIGQKSIDNGVVIAIKPKNDTDGEAWIATGDGLEGALPDIFCKRIFEDEMVPHFREEDYYGGICAALDVILPVCAGEYSFEQYQKDNPSDDKGVGIIIALVIIASVAWVARKGRRSGFHWSSGGYHGPSGGSFGGGWSGGSSGGGISFGGGHFSGGGGGGKW